MWVRSFNVWAASSPSCALNSDGASSEGAGWGLFGCSGGAEWVCGTTGWLDDIFQNNKAQCVIEWMEKGWRQRVAA